MLALKKKREAEQKAAAAAEASSSPATDDTPVAAVTPQNGDHHEAGPAKISLLGIGGIKKKDTSATGNSNNNNNMKKRTPGEIRIQKGNLSFLCSTTLGSPFALCTLNTHLLRFVFLLLYLLRIQPLPPINTTTTTTTCGRHCGIGWRQGGQNYLPQPARL
jgi:hypothetical protein